MKISSYAMRDGTRGMCAYCSIQINILHIPPQGSKDEHKNTFVRPLQAVCMDMDVWSCHWSGKPAFSDHSACLMHIVTATVCSKHLDKEEHMERSGERERNSIMIVHNHRRY